ncbi:MAG: GspE/PulE family protein [Patescibacteria group bacterium]
MPFRTPQLLVDALLERKLLTPEIVSSVQAEAEAQEKYFGEMLIQKGIIGDADLAALKSEIYKLPIAHASDIEIDPQLSEKISDATIRFYKILPFAKDKGILKIVLLDPENIDALQALKFIATEQNLTLEKFIITYQDFTVLRDRFTSLSSEVGKALETIADDVSQKELKITEQEAGLGELTAEAPVTKVVAAIIKHAVESRASDIHIEPYQDLIRLRVRIDGDLQTALTLPGSLLSALITRIKILSELKIDESRLAQDGRFSTKFSDRTVDFRVSTFPTRTGEKVVLRILDPLVGNIELKDLGLEGHNLKVLLENIAKPFGSILVTGPTGSGKSTTLAAILRQMNNDQVNIVTLEDPVENYISGVNQSQIHEEIGYTFANGLRHILRQDPDIIMVGEMRDRETAGLAVQAALTGHVVLSTLHTNNTIGVIPRLIDMGVEKYLIAPSLNLAAAQRLLRKLCPSCKEPATLNPSEAKLLAEGVAKISPEIVATLPKSPYQIFKAGKGCKDCNGKAYKGRVAIFEALAMTDELERVILGDLSEEKLRAEAERQGMLTMYQDGIIKVLRGVTSLEELLQVAQSSEDNAA